MDKPKNAEKCLFFVCKKCDFKCSKESNYKLHIETNKHKRLHDATLKMPKSSSNTFICVCGNKYNHHSSLAKHKRTCKKIHNLLASKLIYENISKRRRFKIYRGIYYEWSNY